MSVITINFLLRWLPLKLVQNLNIAGFLGKTWKKIPIKKKLVYSTLGADLRFNHRANEVTDTCSGKRPP